jgi:hypothetical protein
MHPQPQPWFALDTSLAIGIALAVLAIFGFVWLALFGGHRHVWLRRYSDRRMYMECAVCGKETPGWKIDQPSSHDKDAA